MAKLQHPAPIGWPLLPVPDEAGQLHYPGLDQSVRQSIQVILRTRPGEQLRRPDFGAGLDRFLHEPNSLTTRRRLRDLVLEALGRWEPRIQVDRVDVNEVEGQPARVRVTIVYHLRRTGAVRQLGLSMDLAG